MNSISHLFLLALCGCAMPEDAQKTTHDTQHNVGEKIATQEDFEKIRSCKYCQELRPWLADVPAGGYK
jgi:hypothetical protein